MFALILTLVIIAALGVFVYAVLADEPYEDVVAPGLPGDGHDTPPANVY